MDWELFDGGPRGSEGGVVVADEEYRGSSRITLERDASSRIAAAITCGIYGWMMHTRFFSNLDTARQAYDAMKIDLAGIVEQIPLENDPDGRRRFPEIFDAIKAFVEQYP
jgi:hypothetical protein